MPSFTEYRRQAGLSVSDAEKLLKLSVDIVADYERGSRLPPPREIQVLKGLALSQPHADRQNAREPALVRFGDRGPMRELVKKKSKGSKSSISAQALDQGQVKSFLNTANGKIICRDSSLILKELAPSSVDLFMTSPPFGLVRKKDYGNVDAEEYLKWFKPFAIDMFSALKDHGSLVIDIGGAWNKGQPTRSLYHFKLLIMLCEEVGFHLAQDFYWWNPSRLPTPAEWVTVRRVRVKDAINTVWWLSKTPWPKASNKRVLQPYSPAMKSLLMNGYVAKRRPSGHDISEKFNTDNGAAIPPNLIAASNTESNSFYLRYCEQHGLKPHPARYPAELPEYFIRMLTDAGDLVVDPFAGSCVTGEVAERLKRNWICIEMLPEYCEAAIGRFIRPATDSAKNIGNSDAPEDAKNYYRVAKPGVLWTDTVEANLDLAGGKSRLKKTEADETKPRKLRAAGE